MGRVKLKLVRCPKFVLLMGKTQWERLRGIFGSFVGILDYVGDAHFTSFSFLDL